MKIQHLSCINAHKTLPEAEAWADKILGPSCIIHLWNPDGQELFAVLQQDSVDGMTDMIKSHTGFKTEPAQS